MLKLQVVSRSQLKVLHRKNECADVRILRIHSTEVIIALTNNIEEQRNVWVNCY